MKKGEIPPAFDLRKYEVCSSWKPNMWLSALLARRTYGYYDLIINKVGVSNRNFHPDFPPIEPDQDLLLKWFTTHQNSAIKFLTSPSEVLELHVHGSFLDEQRNIDLLEVCILTDFKEGDGMPEEIGQAWVEAIESVYDEFKNEVAPEYRNLASFYQWAICTKNPFLFTSATNQRQQFGAGPGQLFRGERHFISVDLNTTDSILEMEFKNWLAKKRAETRISGFKEITHDHLKRFANLKLLAYLDLHFWEVANEVKISDSDIMDALKLNPDRLGDQYVKNVLRREAVKMIDDSTFFALRGLAWKQSQAEEDEHFNVSADDLSRAKDLLA